MVKRRDWGRETEVEWRREGKQSKRERVKGEG